MKSIKAYILVGKNGDPKEDDEGYYVMDDPDVLKIKYKHLVDCKIVSCEIIIK